MTHQEAWLCHYQEFMTFMSEHHRRPSKHRLEEHGLLNWLKYAKRLKAQGKLDEQRSRELDSLLQMAESLKRINQYAYRNPHQGQTALTLNFSDDDEPSDTTPTDNP